MRLFFLIPAMMFALVAPMAGAQAADPAKGQPSRAEVIEACMKDMMASNRPGQKNTMTPMQRRTAEEQCRARAEAEEHSQAAKRK
ncbi:MAG: hypothetical protein ACK4FJ_02880 [Ferrovibrio sp.]|uniref:hypothetical protein n=1 Tax=Ferrovibrio sp. TaxID=1917215 RepID=UPI0039199601